ncbi:hypothetical protein [Microseira wollei]|uniref:hypothetical protein n=1 Tax=Microseira wollei TaxID=467598 RepID=UPI001CFDF90A|nr:hypothetical protein [Microseira wollei]
MIEQVAIMLRSLSRSLPNHCDIALPLAARSQILFSDERSPTTRYAICLPSAARSQQQA